MSSCGRPCLDGDIRRHGDATDGLLRSDPVIRGIQRSKIQADLRLAEERLWCAADHPDCRAAQGNNSTFAEFQPVSVAVCYPGHDAADD